MTSDNRTKREQQLIELITVERPRVLTLITTVDGGDSAHRADRVAWELGLAHVDARNARLRASTWSHPTLRWDRR